MANLFLRTYTFVDGTTAYGSQVEAEIGNIVTVLNNLNTGSTNWGIVSALHATSVPLTADCSSGTQHIADFKNNSVIKASISSDGTITSTKTSSQVVLGVTNTTTISATAPSASRVLTLVDPGANANIMLSAGNTVDMSMNSHKITGLSNGTAPTDAVAFGQLKNLQLLSSTSSSQGTTTGTTFVAAGPSVAITLSNSANKLKITTTGCLRASSVGSGATIATIYRDSTDLGSGGIVDIQASVVTGGLEMPCSMTIIDSPGDTSSHTYQVRIKSTNSGNTATYPSVGNAASPAWIIAEEIQ